MIVPFTPELKGGVFSASGTPIERQVADIINRHVSSGWEFVSYQTTHVRVKPGCMAPAWRVAVRVP